MRKGSPRDTSKATNARKQNAEQFLVDTLWEHFEEYLDYNIDDFNPKTDEPYFSALAVMLSNKNVLTPTKQKAWTANSAKNYWRKYIEIKRSEFD